MATVARRDDDQAGTVTPGIDRDGALRFPTLRFDPEPDVLPAAPHGVEGRLHAIRDYGVDLLLSDRASTRSAVLARHVKQVKFRVSEPRQRGRLGDGCACTS
jgi:hypothetical protein